MCCSFVKSNGKCHLVVYTDAANKLSVPVIVWANKYLICFLYSRSLKGISDLSVSFLTLAYHWPIISSSSCSPFSFSVHLLIVAEVVGLLSWYFNYHPQAIAKLNSWLLSTTYRNQNWSLVILFSFYYEDHLCSNNRDNNKKCVNHTSWSRLRKILECYENDAPILDMTVQKVKGLEQQMWDKYMSIIWSYVIMYVWGIKGRNQVVWEFQKV